MKKIYLIGILAFITMAEKANAQDRHFVWTYESTTAPKGGIDIEPWITYRTGRENFYTRLDTRLEIETGITDRLQTSVYFNTKHTSEAIADSNNILIGLKGSSGFSISNEWKLNILNPLESGIGFGLYGEYTLSADETELEYKLLFDKRTEKNIFALNLVGEHEFELEFEIDDKGEGEIETEQEMVFEADLAYMRLLKPNLGLGLEIKNENVIEHGEHESSPVFCGPTLFFSKGSEGGNSFFLILSVMPQITSIAGEHSGKPDLEGHEKIQSRILFGFSF